EVSGTEGLDFSPDGSTLAVGDRKGGVHLIRSDSGRPIRDLLLDTGEQASVRFAAKDRLVVRSWSIGWSPILFVDTTTGTIRHRLKSHEKRDWSIWSADVMPDGKRAIAICRVYPDSGGLEDLVVIWDIESGKELRRIPISLPKLIAVAPSGNIVATSYA